MQEYKHDNFLVSTDLARLDVTAVHNYLSSSYWAQGISKEVVARAIQNSLCFGVYLGDEQIGFARVVTDKATFAYLCDVYILESHRGKGLSKWLMRCVVEHPDLQGLRRFSLATRDAHELYKKFGFTPLGKPESQMEILNQDVYQNK